MMSFIQEWILNIITLALFIALLEILLPSGKMKKYVNLITGVILIIAIINPFLRWIRTGVDLQDHLAQSSSTMSRLEIEKGRKNMEEAQLKQIVEVYRKKIIGQLEKSAAGVKGVSEVSADVIINEDPHSETFGEIKRAYLEIRTDNGTGSKTIKPVAQVEKIRIGKQKTDQSAAESTKKEVDPSIRKGIEDRVMGLFQMERENIVISLRE